MLEARASRRRPSVGRLLACALALALVLPGSSIAEEGSASEGAGGGASEAKAQTPRSKRRDPADWGDWRNYQPSVILGFGITWDQADSSLDGVTRWSPAFVANCIQPYGIGTGQNCVASSDSFDGWYAGGALNTGGRVRLPELDLPGHPRAFINASVVIQRQDEKALASSGVPTSNWLSSSDLLGGGGQQKFLRLEQTIDPQTLLFLGLGAEFLLPIDLYNVRLNASVNYFRTKASVGARYDFLDAATEEDSSFGSLDEFSSRDLITHGIAPGVGLDVDIGETEHLEFGFYADTFVGFPLSDGGTLETLYNGYPISSGQTAVERVDFRHERGINISVMIGIRVSLAND